MQTFLPYSSNELTAKSLDYRRLGKQRVEAKQILMVLIGESKGWANHPATKMWNGHEVALCKYAIAMCDEWINRGYIDNLKPYFEERLKELQRAGFEDSKPWFYKDGDFMLSHQSNLVRKDPEYYIPIFGNIADDMAYKWTP